MQQNFVENLIGTQQGASFINIIIRSELCSVFINAIEEKLYGSGKLILIFESGESSNAKVFKVFKEAFIQIHDSKPVSVVCRELKKKRDGFRVAPDILGLRVRFPPFGQEIQIKLIAFI